MPPEAMAALMAALQALVPNAQPSHQQADSETLQKLQQLTEAVQRLQLQAGLALDDPNRLAQAATSVHLQEANLAAPACLKKKSISHPRPCHALGPGRVA